MRNDAVKATQLVSLCIQHLNAVRTEPASLGVGRTPLHCLEPDNETAKSKRKKSIKKNLAN